MTWSISCCVRLRMLLQTISGWDEPCSSCNEDSVGEDYVPLAPVPEISGSSSVTDRVSPAHVHSSTPCIVSYGYSGQGRAEGVEILASSLHCFLYRLCLLLGCRLLLSCLSGRRASLHHNYLCTAPCDRWHSSVPSGLRLLRRR